MKIIAFTWTTPALLAGAKTVTRRNWKPEYAARFKANEFVLAYDKSPRAGGRPVALIKLTQEPRYESLSKMPDYDFSAEGLRWLTQAKAKRFWPECDEGAVVQNEFLKFHDWRDSGGSMWVIRFELLLTFDDDVTPCEARALAHICQTDRAHGAKL